MGLLDAIYKSKLAAAKRRGDTIFVPMGTINVRCPICRTLYSFPTSFNHRLKFIPLDVECESCQVKWIKTDDLELLAEYLEVNAKAEEEKSRIISEGTGDIEREKAKRGIVDYKSDGRVIDYANNVVLNKDGEIISTLNGENVKNKKNGKNVLISDDEEFVIVDGVKYKKI